MEAKRPHNLTPFNWQFQEDQKGSSGGIHTVLDAYVQFLKQQSKLNWINLGNQCKKYFFTLM